jgi:diguanylate cyclase (GGDEF)-like protein
MRQTIEEHRKWPEGIPLTVSIGLVEYSGETDPEELIKKADIAMYRAKATGRNRVCLF